MPVYAVSARVTRIELHTVTAETEDAAREAARRKILAREQGDSCEIVSIRQLDFGDVECG